MNKNNTCYKRIRRKGITIAFLGIDGTGKSTHAEKLSSWLQENKISSIIIPFHKWMFAGILKRRIGKYVDSGRNPDTLRAYTPEKYSLSALLKPPVALLDNILMFYYSKWKFKEYDVIIFDRFVCATLIKSKALNYNVDWLRPIWQNIKVDIGLVLNAPIQKSLNEIDDRGNHILYTSEQLGTERKEYLEIARKCSYQVFDTSKPLESTHEDIKKYLGGILFQHPSK
jgi:dTMP kinase